MNKLKWLLPAFFVLIVIVLVMKYRADFLKILPFLLIAACPLMHFFHKHGKDGEGH